MLFLTLTSERLGGRENKTTAKARNMLTYFVTNEEIISTKNTYPFSNPNPIEPVTVILSIHKQQYVCRELWPSRLLR